MIQTPKYIKSLLIRNGNKGGTGRKVWSIDLETVWLPFFYATNIQGDTSISAEALGAPLRLVYNADGSVKFSRTGRPIYKVAKELSDEIKLIRENFVATLQSFANSVININQEAYKAELEKAKQAGEPIINHDMLKLNEALARLREKEIAEALAKAEASVKAEAEPQAKEKVAVR